LQAVIGAKARALFGSLRGYFVSRARRAERRWTLLRLPKGRLHWLSVVLVWVVAVAWFVGWCDGNAPALFDPFVQPNDAATAIFPFHRYAEGAPLANDPIALEMLEYQPYLYRLLFRITVPMVGLLAAAKIVQSLLILIVLAAGVVLMRSRRAGLGVGLLFAFLFLHDGSVQTRIFGGLPRGFGFPTIALWLAGALAHRPWARRVAAVLAAATYPTALAMLLGAEGIYAVRGLARPGFATLLRRLKHYFLLVLACVALLAPAVLIGMQDGGPIHTLDQARSEPAFGTSGRLWILPFGHPGRWLGESFVGAFMHTGSLPAPKLLRAFVDYEAEIAVLIASAVLALLVFDLSARVTPVATFLLACLLLYAMSRIYAFKLYSPERYYSIGVRASALGFAASAVGLLLPRLKVPLRQAIRNACCAAAILFAWFGLGDGVRSPRMGLAIPYREDAMLYRFVSSLPKSTRVASHILDGDGIPLFSARANNGAFETLQPWLTRSWQRQKARTQDTLRALYATDREQVLAYAKKYNVSHLLLNKRRYGADFAKRSRSFEPFSTFSRRLLAGIEQHELALADPPPSSVVFKQRQWLLVSVAKLERAWAEKEHAPPPAEPEDEAEAETEDEAESEDEARTQPKAEPEGKPEIPE
jgi:hypothetical protein